MSQVKGFHVGKKKDGAAGSGVRGCGLDGEDRGSSLCTGKASVIMLRAPLFGTKCSGHIQNDAKSCVILQRIA